MKIFCLLGLCLCLGLTAKADESARGWETDIFISPEVRYERDTNQDWVLRQPLGIAAGARYLNTALLLEYSSFSESSGNDTLSVARQHREYVLWLKENLWTFGGAFDLFAGVGAGASQEDVTTTLYGSSETDSGGLQAMGGLSAGVEARWKILIASLEGRLLTGGSFDPNPEGSLVLRLGLEF